MERPCFPHNSHLNPANNFSWVMTDHLRDEAVLNITGNESSARRYFKHVERKLARISQKTFENGHIFPFLDESQCSTELLTTDLMPNIESLATTWRPTTNTQNNITSVSHHQLEE